MLPFLPADAAPALPPFLPAATLSAGAAARRASFTDSAGPGCGSAASQSPKRARRRTTAPPFDWYSTSTTCARPSACSTASPESARPGPSGSPASASLSRAVATARARRSAPGRARSADGMRRSAAAPPRAVTVPSAQSMLIGPRVSSSTAAPRRRACRRSAGRRQRGERAGDHGPETGGGGYSHSIVAGGLEEMS